MKKFTMILVLMMFMVVPCVAEQVQPETARRVAQTFLSSNRGDTNNLVDISAKAGFPNLYIFTTEHSFVVMSTDDRVQPILGYSLIGSFVTENIPNNLRWWLQSYSDQIQYVVESSLSPTQEVIRQWQELASGTVNTNRSRTAVAPLITTTWGQGTPYNLLCPQNTVTGCVATAMAQIMKYWNYPAHGIGWHSYTPYYHPEYGEQTANFNATTYDWNNMVDHYNYYYDEQGNFHWDDTQTDEQKQAVATLMYHCGVAVEMEYDPSGSGASSYITPALFNYFNFSSTYIDREDYDDSEWISMLQNEMNASRPVFYCGSGSGGHAFVCDGYDSGTYGNYYFHFNWGWGGDCDGYFSVNNMTPGGSNFNSYQYATIGIQPSANNAIPTNLTYTQNRRNVTLHWTSTSGAASYNIYRDMNLVGNVNTNTYTDVAPYGTSVYYVRSVDGSGELSLSTNTISVDVTPMVDDLSATVSGNNVDLSWTAPEWGPSLTPTATLTYGEGLGAGMPGWTYYYAHRYPAADLAQYANKAVYKVETSVFNSNYYPQTVLNVYVYTNTINGNPDPNSLAFTATQTYTYSLLENWIYLVTIDLPQPIILSGTTDLWVVMSQVESGGESGTWYEAPVRSLDTYNPDACYKGSSPTTLSPVNDGYNRCWTINTYLTDGIYSYNIYRDGSSIANNVTNTTYSDDNLATGVYNYYVKTNYYGGETDASNQVSVQVGNSNSSQTSTFAQGYNWWCSYIEQDSIDGLGILQEGLGDNGVTIRSQASGYTDYYSSYGWYGSLTSINNESSYRVITNAPCTVTMTGAVAEPSQHPITLGQGWTWIGYVPATAMSVDAAMAGVNAVTGDKLKSQQGYADYYGEDYGWFGSLNTIEPGMGLMYYSVNGNPVPFTYPDSNRGGDLKQNLTAKDNHWKPNTYTYPDNMTMMAVVELDDMELSSDNYELAAFANGECRGSVKLTYAEPLHRHVAFLTISGKDVTELGFRLYDTETGMEYYDAEESLNFVANAIVGNAEDLYVIHFRGMAGMDEFASRMTVYPNPVNRGEKFSIGMNAKRKSPVRVEIVNALGAVVSVETPAQTPASIVAPITAGVYTLRITVEGKETIVRKLVVK